MILILSVLNFISCFFNQFRRWQPTSGPFRSSVPSVTFAAETMLSSHGKAYKKAKKTVTLRCYIDMKPTIMLLIILKME
jgi:hypothetical protein